MTDPNKPEHQDIIPITEDELAALTKASSALYSFPLKIEEGYHADLLRGMMEDIEQRKRDDEGEA